MKRRDFIQAVTSVARKADLVIGMEHGLSQSGRDGELALLKAYRDADAF